MSNEMGLGGTREVRESWGVSGLWQFLRAEPGTDKGMGAGPTQGARQERGVSLLLTPSAFQLASGVDGAPLN